MAEAVWMEHALTDRRNIGSRLENWARLYTQHRGVQQEERRAFDQADAELLDRAMVGLPTLQRSLLWWCCVKLDTPADAGLTLGMANMPVVRMFDAFRVAQVTLEALLAPQER